MATTQTTTAANPSPGETKPSPAQQPGILPVSAEMIALQTGDDGDTAKGGEMTAVQGDGGGGDAGGANKEATAPGAAQQEGMANTKENTPMGLLNSIGRFNNLKPNYELLGEEGPAHQKTFTVQLTFGEQTYTGVGTSIKRAQHEAAQKALDGCKLPAPEKKAKPAGYRLLRSPNTNALTPTVQLNSYSLKTGVPVKYSVINTSPMYSPGGYRRPPYNQPHRYSNHTNAAPPHPSQGGGGDAKDNEADTTHPLNSFHGPRQPNPAQFRGPPPIPENGMGVRPRGPRGPGPHHFNYMHYPTYEMRPIYRQRFRRPYPQVFSVKLSVGNREFIGQGMNQRAARQDAAEKAMKSVTDSPFPVKKDQATSMLDNDQKEKAPSDSTDAGNNKSEISQVYEVANFNGLNLEFKVLDESGPPHQKEYKIQCTVGNITVEESGSSKKEAKRKAAASVLPKLKALPPPVKSSRPGPRPTWKPPAYKKPSITKKNADDPDFGAVGMNPISRLVQICQSKKLKDPFFEVLNDQPIPDRRVHPTIYRHIFTMQVTVGDKTAEGKGPTKKEAKKEAAEAMLVLMNYKPSQPDTPVPGADVTPGKPVLKQPQTNGEVKKEEEAQNADRKVTFKEDQPEAPPVADIKVPEPVKPEPVPGSQQGPQIPGITPGLFPMMPGMKTIQAPFPQQPQQQPQGLNRAPGAPVSHAAPRNFNPALSADIASELLLTHHSMTAHTIIQTKSLPIQLKSTRPQHMLEYMGAVTGLDIAFTDFPQSNQSEYLTEVRISTDPPVRFHGTSHSTDAAHDLASLNVLRALAGCPPEESTRVVPPSRPLVQGMGGLNAQ